MDTVISAEDVSFAYDGESVPIISGLSLSLGSGQIVSVVGGSGSGKTTLLKVLAGIVQPTSGVVKRRGRTFGGFVFQSPVLLDWLSVRENIAFPRKPDEGDRFLRSLIAELELEDIQNRHPRELSGGMRSRVQLARALHKRPAVLFLDEAFSALDERLRFQLNILTKRLQEARGFAVIMVSHSVEEAVLMGKRVLIMRRSDNKVSSEIHETCVSKHNADSDLQVFRQVDFIEDVAKVRAVVMLNETDNLRSS